MSEQPPTAPGVYISHSCDAANSTVDRQNRTATIYVEADKSLHRGWVDDCRFGTFTVENQTTPNEPFQDPNVTRFAVPELGIPDMGLLSGAQTILHDFSSPTAP